MRRNHLAVNERSPAGRLVQSWEDEDFEWHVSLDGDEVLVDGSPTVADLVAAALLDDPNLNDVPAIVRDVRRWVND